MIRYYRREDIGHYNVHEVGIRQAQLSLATKSLALPTDFAEIFWIRIEEPTARHKPFERVNDIQHAVVA